MVKGQQVVKVVNYNKSKPGKHGSVKTTKKKMFKFLETDLQKNYFLILTQAKIRVTGLNIFNQKKVEGKEKTIYFL